MYIEKRFNKNGHWMFFLKVGDKFKRISHWDVSEAKKNGTPMIIKTNHA